MITEYIFDCWLVCCVIIGRREDEFGSMNINNLRFIKRIFFFLLICMIYFRVLTHLNLSCLSLAMICFGIWFINQNEKNWIIFPFSLLKVLYLCMFWTMVLDWETGSTVLAWTSKDKLVVHNVSRQHQYAVFTLPDQYRIEL